MYFFFLAFFIICEGFFLNYLGEHDTFTDLLLLGGCTFFIVLALYGALALDRDRKIKNNHHYHGF